MKKNKSNSHLRVLAYHKITNQVQFRKQVNFLKENYTIISLEELNNHLFKGVSLPQNPILITFDDADVSLYNIAFPVLKEFHAPGVIFVITDLIDTNKPYWWDEITYYLGKEVGNKKVWDVKDWPNKKREKFLKQLRELNSDKTFRQEQISLRQLREMQASGITLCNHSHTHPMFDQCTPEEIKKELNNSILTLHDDDMEAKVFAYPNGNYTDKAEELLKKYNIKLAFLFDHKINQGINPLRISRLIVNDTTSLIKFKFILSGWHTKILPITKKLGNMIRNIKQ